MMTDLTMPEKAEKAWQGTAPDWVRELAMFARSDGLNGCAKRLSYSVTTISQVINNKYLGDLSNVEERVRGALMKETVPCPVLGALPRDQCLDWQAKPLAVTNSTRTKVYRACRAGCPHSRLKGGGRA